MYLKRCPYCNSKNVTGKKAAVGKSFTITCQYCGKSISAPSMERAGLLWRMMEVEHNGEKIRVKFNIEKGRRRKYHWRTKEGAI